MMTYLDCWTSAATALFSQALAGEPRLQESLPRPIEAGSFGFSATLTGDPQGRFSIILDAALLKSPLLGEGVDQKAGWGELLREVAEAAAGELLARTGQKCTVDSFQPLDSESQVSCAFQLRSQDRAWVILVRDEVRPAKPAAKQVSEGKSAASPEDCFSVVEGGAPSVSPGVELLLDVELEATLRFGCREMPLGELLELGPGDVVHLDRHISDPVDLLVGDKIVAHGEVVLVNGNFGLRVIEVASPRKRLETIRCLF